MGLLLGLVLSLLLTACNANPTTTSSSPRPSAATTKASVNEPGLLAIPATPNTADPIIAERLKLVQTSLNQSIPVIQLTQGLDENQRTAQEIATQNAQLQRYMRVNNATTAIRAEIFGVYPLRDSDFTATTASCRQSTCYRVEMYNYAYNLTITGVVDVKARKVIAVNTFVDTQPDIPEHLKQLAIRIATNAPEVEQILGFKPSEDQALMANTKTALNRTRCERSLHLCVAPTFVQGEEALWAIVDLTDLVLVGVQWTKVGQSVRQPITEKNLQDQVVTAKYCERNTALGRNGWQMDYMLTSSDGLRVSSVSFNGRAVLRNAKLVDWHVSYSTRRDFGYSDAVGCPIFSQAAVVAVGGPKVQPLMQDNIEAGFTLTQDFWSIGWPEPCNYYYQQRYEFYNDGRFRIAVANIGRGCGNDGTYRPVTRIAFAGEQNNFAEWNGKDWENWTNEKWQLQTPQTAYTSEGYQYRLSDPNKQGYYLEPGKGQFGDGGRGDNAYVYVTRYNPNIDEGESDLVTLGPCCNTDYRQGPEKFIEPNPEPITNTALVLWYVAKQKNDDTPGREYCWAQATVEQGLFKIAQHPCYSGPMFVPLK